VNHKRVFRLYRGEELAMRIRQRRRIRWNGAVTNPAATRPNQRWSIDFVSDCMSRGRVIRMLTLVDDCTPECPAIEVDTSLGGLRVRRVLDRVAEERGLPEAIVLDNGPEFRGRALAAPGAKNQGCDWSSFSRASLYRMPMWKASTVGSSLVGSAWRQR
jgi:putative transposase